METLEGPQDPPYLRNVGLLMTYHCQASCAHCIIRAGPDRHEEVALEDAREWIRQIAAYRDRYVIVLSLTGGEPFSNLRLLEAVLDLAGASKLHVSIVTNGFWATRRETAKNLLRRLPRICFLSISTDAYHQEFVPLEHAQNAIWAARECGIPYYVTIITGNRNDPDYLRLKAEILKETEPDKVRVGITFPMGRAARMASGLKFDFSDDPPREACQAASSPCIFPDGRVYGCIGPLIDLQHQHPLLLGNARENSLAAIFDKSETNVILHALRVWGPGRIVAWLRDAGLGSELPRKYIVDSPCNTCYALLTNPALRRHLDQLAQDPEFRRMVAYGRLYHLNETGMLELAGQC